MATRIKVLDASGAAAAQAASRLASNLPNAVELGGRAFLVSLFLISGLNKIGGYEATAAYMNANGVPGALLPAAIGFEVLAAIAVIIGWKTRITAFLLAAFTMLAGFIFHSNFTDPTEILWFLNNVAITGGFLLLVANGPGSWSVDQRTAN